MAKDFHKDFKYRKIKKPNSLLAGVVRFALRRISKGRNVNFVYDQSFLPYKKQQVVYLCQHTSRDDFIYVSAGLPHTNVHYICGYQNIFNKTLYPLLKRLGVIAKYLYQPDMQATKQILQATKRGGSLVLFPEGIQSTSGSSHPINPATLKLLAKLKLPVILVTINGAYFTKPRYSRDIRKGQITVTYSELFSDRDFENLSQEELYQKMLEKFKYNEFEIQKSKRVQFIGKKPNIDGLDNIIYKCPHCLKEGVFSTEGDTMTCSECGFAVRMDAYYDIFAVNKILPFKNTDEWYKWQRQQVNNDIVSDNFVLQSKVEINVLNTQKLDNDYSLITMGEGQLTLTNKGLTYSGSYDGQEVQLFFEAKAVYSLVISLDHDFDLYYKDQYYNFKLLENENLMTKWMLSAEQIHNLYDQSWASVSEEVYNVAK